MYEQSDMPLIYIAKESRTSLGNISRLAARHDWRRRRPISCKVSRKDEVVRRLQDRARVVSLKLARHERELGIIMDRLRELRGADG